MHFRTRNNVVQVVRTHYDAATKKAKGAIVARMVRANPEISEAMREALTPDEVAEVQAWIDGQSRLAQLNAEHAAWTLGEQLEQAAGWFEQAPDDETTRRIAAEAMLAWQRLRKALRQRQFTE